MTHWRTAFTLIFSSLFLFLAACGDNASSNKPASQAAQSQGLKGDPNVPIGGPFTLTKSDGARVSEADFIGKYSLYYFGYTYCPDVCPLDLQKLTLALEEVEKRGIDLAPFNVAFITIDPDRDTPEVMGEYIKSIHPHIMGLSGSPEDIDQVKQSFRVYATKDESADEGNEDYLVAHSNMMYLMDKDGYYIQHFSDANSYKEMADVFSTVLRQE